MAGKKRTEIRIESNEILLVRRRRKFSQVWCDECGKQVLMLTHEESALVTGVSEREICRRIEAGLAHFIETAQGKLLICFDSLVGVEARAGTIRKPEREMPDP